MRHPRAQAQACTAIMSEDHAKWEAGILVDAKPYLTLYIERCRREGESWHTILFRLKAMLADEVLP